MNVQIRQEAAEWLIDIRADDPDAATRERFAAWLRTSPEHVRAYLELVTFWEDASLYDSARKVDVESLIALADTASNVVALESSPRIDHVATDSSIPRARPTVTKMKRYRLAAAATVAGLAVAISAWFLLRHDLSYATDVGEQRSIMLADGSSVELNAVSRIRVRFSEHERVVELLEGQGLFRVAKNKSRPFTVVSGDARVRAVGTQFDVNRKPSGTVVTVLEGTVAVLPKSDSTLDDVRSSSSAPPIEIAAGEQVSVTARAAARPHRANLVTATAWTQQQLIFDSTPLSEVAEEFNRFNTRSIVVASPQLADFHVSGTFPALDPASLPRFVHFLRAQPGLQVLESDGRVVITQK